MSTVKNDKKTLFAWAFYDWANSVYALVITTAIFPLFYEGYTKHMDQVSCFGFEFTNTVLVSFVSAALFLTVSILSPILSGIADVKGNKKNFLKLFCYVGAISCCGLAFFDFEHLELGMIFYYFAGLGFWCSLVFYNAYLPEIATVDQHDAISAKGFSLGYLGSSILLIICLVLILVVQEEGSSFYIRSSFVLTGLWWIIFAQYTLRKLPDSEVKDTGDQSLLMIGINELRSVWSTLQSTTRLKRFLGGFFIYSMAVQTIMLMASFFGAKEISWGSDTEKTTGLIVSMLLIQFVAIAGAYGTSKLSSILGNLKTIAVILTAWMIICVTVIWVNTPIQFYICAAAVGLVMGGIQSLSRSTYSKFLPPNTHNTSSFFSFYDVSEKIGIVIGMVSYGVIEQLTGNMRNSILLFGLLFLVGIIQIIRTPKEEVSA